MQNVAIYQSEAVSKREITSQLVNDFVNWVDRSAGTTRAYWNNLRQLMAWLRFTNCRYPQRQDIIEYRDWLLSEHFAIKLDPASPSGWSYRINKNGKRVKLACKPATVSAYIRTAKQLFSWMESIGLYANIAKNIHTPKVCAAEFKKDSLTPDEVLIIEKSIRRKAIDAVERAASFKKDSAGRQQRSDEQGKRLAAMYQLAVNAGLRAIELSRARIRDFEIKRGQAWLYIWGKGRSEADQKKPIAPEVAACIQDYLHSRSDAYGKDSPLFVATGNRNKGGRIAATTISTMLKRAMVDAGFDSDRLTAHSLRHSAGTAAMLATGDNIYLVQQYLRHSDPKVTERYTHRKREDIQAGIARQVYELYHGADPDLHHKQIGGKMIHLYPHLGKTPAL